jgi:hypothetical protein
MPSSIAVMKHPTWAANACDGTSTAGMMIEATTTRSQDLSMVIERFLIIPSPEAPWTLKEQLDSDEDLITLDQDG